ncbi:hypothetical protein GCM10023220_35160 [Streptomyces ziwulingensis]|uniref:Transposase DDE domain-containing protein n=1 Tax=Streptomyces ziwulingensis TaxID=1045501 RepID=A0ABP9BZY1_9ACTN
MEGWLQGRPGDTARAKARTLQAPGRKRVTARRPGAPCGTLSARSEGDGARCGRRPSQSGEPVAGLLRPGNAGSKTAADYITTTPLALTQVPKLYRRGRQTLIRTDSAGGTQEFIAWLAQRGRWPSHSVGMTITDAIHQAVLKTGQT